MAEATPLFEEREKPGGDRLAVLVRSMLEELGEDPSREGLARTPWRVADSMRFLLSGYELDVDQVINGAVFEGCTRRWWSSRTSRCTASVSTTCCPSIGKAHVAYLPNGRILGLSKIPRVIDVFARRLQVQERLTTQVADALHHALEPLGVAVVIEAVHLCMMMRGVQKQTSEAVTSALTGAFRNDEKCRTEFLSLIGRSSLAAH